MDRQSSGLLTDTPVAHREYEGVRNVVGGSDIAHFAEVRVARRLHRWNCSWESGIWISETAEVSVARRLHCGITFGIQGWISETSEVRVARLLHRRDYVWNPGQTRVCNGLSTGLEVKSRFLSVRLREGPRVWLVRCVLDSPRG